MLYMREETRIGKNCDKTLYGFYLFNRKKHGFIEITDVFTINFLISLGKFNKVSSVDIFKENDNSNLFNSNFTFLNLDETNLCKDFIIINLLFNKNNIIND